MTFVPADWFIEVFCYIRTPKATTIQKILGCVMASTNKQRMSYDSQLSTSISHIQDNHLYPVHTAVFVILPAWFSLVWFVVFLCERNYTEPC